MSWASVRTQRVVAGLVITLAACLQAAGLLQLPLVEHLDRWIYDSRVRLAQPPRDERIVIVDIDEKSLGQIGRWPWPRARVAELVERLVDAHGAAAVGVDLVFAEAEHDADRALVERLLRDSRFDAVERPLVELARSLDSDARLARALAGRPVVLGYYFTSDRGGRRSGGLPAPVYAAGELAGLGYRITSWDGFGANLAVLQRAAPASGFFNPYVDSDGVVRRLPLLAEHDGQVYESLAVALLRRYLDNAPMELTAEGVVLHGERRRVRIPATRELLALVPFGGRGGPSGGRFRYVSAADVLNGALPADALQGKIVLVGTSAPGLTDLRATPVSEVYPGVEIHASLLAGALDDSVRTTPALSGRAELAVTAAVGVALAVALPAVGPLGVVLLSSLAVMTLLAWNGVAFSNLGWVLPVAGMLLLVMVQAVLNLVTGYVMEGRSRRAMLALFGEYVAPQLVERMARDPRSVRIDSGDKELTILFADIRGFTRMAETMRPEQLREYLNRFLTAMTDVIHRHHGTVDKYIGDAVMAFWGAPIDDPDHADHAVAAALDMQREVARLSDAFAREGLPTLAVGIGLNTGLVRVGDMGSRARRAYTVIGDAVNLAARLEALTKHVDAAGIVAGDATRRAARAHRFESLGLHAVPGRQEPVHAWVPMAATAQAGQGDGAEPARSLLSREQMAAIAASAASAATAASAAARASAAAISPAVAPSVAASPVAVSPAGPPAAPDTAEPGVSAAGAAPR